MRRRGPLLALGVLVLAGLPSAQGAEERTPCQKLSPKDDLAPAKRVKLVARQDGDTTVLKGCVLPAGRVFVVATRYQNDDSSGDFLIRQVEGHQVVLNGDFTSDRSHAHFTYHFDIKKGRRYELATRCSQSVPDQCGRGPHDETARRVRINANGQSAAIVTSKSSDLETVIGYSPRGNRKILDEGAPNEIPLTSLEVDGRVASWTHNGAPMSAKLPKVTECQKLNARPPRDLAPGTRRVKIVERENTDNGTDLIGCVLPDGKLSVIASSGKQPGLDRKYQLLQVAGHYALVRGETINQYGHGVSTYVYDIKKASSYNLAEACFDAQGPACHQTHAKTAFVNAQGQAAAIVDRDGASNLQVVGFKSTGASKVLDTGTAAEIPPSSLRLEGHVVRWRHSGVPRSATLSG